MKISDLHSMPLYSNKIVDANEGFSYKDNSKTDVIFISEHIPLSTLLSPVINKFRFSKKFNNKIYANKNIITPKCQFHRNLNKLRASFIKSHALLETDKKESNFYDLTLEGIAYKKSYGFNAIMHLNNQLSLDPFITNNEKEIDIFWILPYSTLDDKKLDTNNFAILRSMHLKNFILDPKHNDKISNIYLLFPFDDNDDKHYKGLQFLTTRVYSKGIEINYPRIKALIDNNIKHLNIISKKHFLDIEIEKKHADDVIKIDETYYEGEEKEKNNIITDTPVISKNNDDEITKEKVLTNDPSQINVTTQDQLKLDYMKNKYNTEILNMMESSIKAFNPSIVINKYSIENADDGTTVQDKYTFELEDTESNHKKNISILVPRLIDNKFFKIYDKKYVLTNQVYSNLVNKINESTVAFTSSHMKTIIYTQGKFDDRIGKYFSKNTPSIGYVNNYVTNENKNVPNSLHVIFKYSPIFEYKDYYISYDLYRSEFILENDNNQEHPKKMIIGLKKNLYPSKTILSDKDATHNYIKDVYSKHGKDAVIIYNVSSDSINNKPFLIEMKKELEEKDSSIKKMPIPGSSQFARMNIAGKKVPVLITMLIAFRNLYPSENLVGFFKKYFHDNVHYDVNEKSLNMDNVISIKLSDAYMNFFIFDSLVASELLFSILRKLDMSMYSSENLQNNNDIDLILYSYFNSQKLQPDVAISSIQTGISSMLDPITIEMLKKSKYVYPMGSNLVKPLDIIEILYYCVYLLNDRMSKSGNDFSGYRIRNMETIPAMFFKLFSNISAQAKKDSESKLKNRKKAIDYISILPNALLEQFRNLTTFESFSDLNVSSEMGAISKVTYKGFGGMNNNRSISYDLRATDPSAIGFIDVGNNVDNLNVGSNRMMPFNPNISNIRGDEAIIKNLKNKVMNNETLTDEETSMLLSFDTYLEPYIASSADAPRVCMSSIQARHGIPLSSYDDLPIKTGIEDTIKQVVSSSFSIKAPEDENNYKVKSINDKTKEIELISGTKTFKVSYKDKVVSNSGGGFHLLKEFEPCVKIGEKVVKGQAVALDKGSFKNGNYTNAKLLRTTLLNFGETLEDGAIVSESAAKELEFNYVTEKSILIRNDQTILKMLSKIGEEVSVGSSLLVFSKDDSSDELNSIFGNINKNFEENEGLGLNTIVKSKYPGKIVDIKIQYNGELRNIKALKEALKHIPKENVQQIKTDRIAGEIAPNGILVTYYILTKIPAMTGSKATAQSTKSVFVVWPDDKMPRTMDGERIDYIFSTFSIITRIIFVLVR